MKIHGDDVVRTSAGQEVSDERARLSNPLAVADLGLKGRRLRRRLSREAVDDRAAVEVGRLVRLV